MTKRYNKIDLDIERRGYVWQCTATKLRKYRTPTPEDRKPCGGWNAYFGRKWLKKTNKDVRWAPRCTCVLPNGEKCRKKRNLSLAKVVGRTEDTWFDSLEAAQAKADELNQQLDHERAVRNNHREPEAVL